jgi:hypothetical protein
MLKNDYIEWQIGYCEADKILGESGKMLGVKYRNNIIH